MTSRNNALAVLLLVLLTAFLAACTTASRIDPLRPNALLQCAIERGMGGTGLTDQDSGMGGTGVIVERGMGGTGISVGVLGTVTGFGSICVNGTRIVYDDTTPVTESGLSMTAHDLQRGVTVVVTAQQTGDHLHASSIEIAHALVGPVTDPVNAAGVLKVMGVAVETAFALGTDAATLVAGDMVAVDGLQRPDGVVDATRIDRSSAQTVSVRGLISDAAPTRMRVGTVLIGSRGIEIEKPAVLNGRWAVLTGVWSNDLVVADRIRLGSDLDVRPGARISMEGYLQARADGGYEIRGLAVTGTARTPIGSTTLGRLAQGQRVFAIGVREAGQNLGLLSVVVPDHRNPLGADVAVERSPVSAEQTYDARSQLQETRGSYGSTTLRPSDSPLQSGGARAVPLELQRGFPPPMPPMGGGGRRGR